MDDLLFSFTEWLRTTFLVDLSDRIADTALSNAIITHFWVVPIIQVIHILSLAAAFGAVVMINLRIFDFAGTDRTLAETERRYVRWIWWALLGLLLSGSLLIIGEPARELINPIFWIKMALVLVSVAVSILFHGRTLKRLGAGGTVTGGIKAASLSIVVFWCVIIMCGRWIAYAPV